MLWKKHECPSDSDSRSDNGDETIASDDRKQKYRPNNKKDSKIKTNYKRGRNASSKDSLGSVAKRADLPPALTR